MFPKNKTFNSDLGNIGFNGNVDNVVVYNRALSTSEVTNATINNVPTEEGVTFYMSCDSVVNHNKIVDSSKYYRTFLAKSHVMTKAAGIFPPSGGNGPIIPGGPSPGHSESSAETRSIWVA